MRIPSHRFSHARNFGPQPYARRLRQRGSHGFSPSGPQGFLLRGFGRLWFRAYKVRAIGR